ncbi:type IV toxin-antitoxin system AbiEi family antitoxin domain-containing protein [Cellulomonas sp. NPDC058312]|uniref:type IV toxin-antitoxin system AbiEi family antitoxin domain-containing protein n=1 Tax=Cellulomonas sp. NPDC058312 TaxID=3346441 RepID=UPI0036E6E0C8
MPTPSTRVLAVVSELAAGQWGLLTTAQAERRGVTRVQLARLTDADVLERVDRGIYATTAAPAEHRALRAAWLTLDPTRTAEERLADPVSAGVASHTSAAALHRLGDLLDDVPELTHTERKQSRRGVRLHRLALADADVTLVDGLPTTTEERTATDLLRDGHDPDHIAQIIGQGVRRGVIDVDDLASRLEPLARRHGQPDGHALVEHLLDLVDLSTAALTRELVASPAGQELVNAGRLAGINDMLAELLPKIDTSTILGLDKVTEGFGRLTGLTGLTGLSKAVQAHTGVQELGEQVRASLLGMSNAPAFRAAIEAANAPVVREAQGWLNSPAGREATRVLAEAHRRQGGKP